MPDSLPKLGFFCEEGAFFPLVLAESARGLCRMVWIQGSVPPSGGGEFNPPEPALPEKVLRRLGEVVDVTGCTAAEVSEKLAPLGLAGLMLLTEPPQMLAADVAKDLGLPYHTPATARVLSDKLAQRQALRDAGVPIPHFALLRPSAPNGQIPPPGAAVSFPAVLKPRQSSGSRYTFIVKDEAGLAAALAECDDQDFILEEHIPGSGRRESRMAEDVMAVEMVVQHGHAHPLAVTGRFPVAYPFRSTGAFMPADLSDDELVAVREMAVASVGALGVERGVLNVDLKISPDGPRVIEVNGRVGGGAPALMAGVGGPPLLRWAMRLALGLDVGPFVPVPPTPVAFNRMVVPPVEAHELVAVGGTDELLAVKGVQTVKFNRRPGQRVDYREGGIPGHVVWMEGVVEDHDELARVLAETDAIVAANFVYR